MILLSGRRVFVSRWVSERYMHKYSARFYYVGSILGLLVLFGAAAWFLGKVHIVANILAVSILVAYLIAPAVDALCRYKIPRTLSISIVYVVLATLIGLFVAYLMPVVNSEFHKLMGNISVIASNLDQITADTAVKLQNYAPDGFEGMLDPENFKLSELALRMQSEAPAIVGGTLPGVLSGFKSAAGVLTGMILVPLLTFYILMDSDKYKLSFMGVIPKAHRPVAAELLHRIDYTIGRYIRGQIIVCVSIGVFVGVALSILGIDYAILIGVFAGVVDIIPYVGVLIGLVPAFVIALINKGILFAIFTIAVLESIHWLEGHIVVPAVVGHSVGLPPLTVMVALLAGAELGGIMGMFVAIPLAAILRVCINYYVEKHKSFGPLTDDDLKFNINYPLAMAEADVECCPVNTGTVVEQSTSVATEATAATEANKA